MLSWMRKGTHMHIHRDTDTQLPLLCITHPEIGETQLVPNGTQNKFDRELHSL